MASVGNFHEAFMPCQVQVHPTSTETHFPKAGAWGHFESKSFSSDDLLKHEGY